MRDPHCFVPCPQTGGEFVLFGRFVELRVGEFQRERRESARIAVVGEQADDRRVKSSAQVYTHLDVAAQTKLDAPLQRVANQFDRFALLRDRDAAVEPQ